MRWSRVDAVVHPLGDEVAQAGVFLEGAGRAVDLVLAKLEHIEMVGNTYALAYVLVHQQDGDALCRQPMDELVDLGTDAWGDHGRRLVEQQDARPQSKRPAELEEALLAAAHRAGEIAALVAQHRELRIGALQRL